MSIITGVLQAADVRCFTRVYCEGNLLSTVSTPRECCIEYPSGVSYDYSGQIEKCHACEGIYTKHHVQLSKASSKNNSFHYLE